jgi:hypothetical protein
VETASGLHNTQNGLEGAAADHMSHICSDHRRSIGQYHRVVTNICCLFPVTSSTRRQPVVPLDPWEGRPHPSKAPWAFCLLQMPDRHRDEERTCQYCQSPSNVSAQQRDDGSITRPYPRGRRWHRAIKPSEIEPTEHHSFVKQYLPIALWLPFNRTSHLLNPPDSPILPSPILNRSQNEWPGSSRAPSHRPRRV